MKLKGSSENRKNIAGDLVNAVEGGYEKISEIIFDGIRDKKTLNTGYSNIYSYSNDSGETIINNQEMSTSSDVTAINSGLTYAVFRPQVNKRAEAINRASELGDI